MKKIILVLISTLILILFFGLIYINYIFLPNIVAPQIIKVIQENTPFIVKIDKIRYLPIKGITIYNLKLFHPIQSIEFKYIKLKLLKLASLTKKTVNLNIKSLLITPFYTKVRGTFEYNPTQKSIHTDIITQDLNLTNISFYSLFPLKIISGILIQPKFNIYLNYKMDSFSFKSKLKFKNLLAENFKNKFEGNMNIDLNSSGKLSDIKNAKYTALIQPTKTNIKLIWFPYNLNEITGKIKLEKDNLNITNLKFNYNNYDFNLNANIKNFDSPEGLLILTSDKLALDSAARLKLINKDLYIENFKATVKDSKALIKGKLEDITNPNLNLRGNLYINIEGFKEYSPKLTKIALSGIIETAFSIKGYIKDLKNINLEAENSSELIKINDFKISNFKSNISMENGKIKILPVSANSYGGKINMEVMADLTNKYPYFTLNSLIENLNLELLRKDIKIGKDTAGLASLALHLEGYGTNLDTITGNAQVEITDGRLLEFPILRGLLGVLGMPELEKVIFKTARGNFKIANKKIYTSNLKLMSDTVNFNLAGNLSFKGDLDFIAKLKVVGRKLERLTSVQKILQSILQQTGSLMGKIKIGGNLAKPKYTLIFLTPSEILERIF